jgi:hypothetical protein
MSLEKFISLLKSELSYELILSIEEDLNRSFPSIIRKHINSIHRRSLFRNEMWGLMPWCSLNSFQDFICSQPNSLLLFKEYYKSYIHQGYPYTEGKIGYSHYCRDLAPSVDRLDNDLGYSFSNIRLVNWRINLDKDKQGSVNGTKEVHVYLISGLFFKSFKSLNEASREMNVHHRQILSCCEGTEISFRQKYTARYTKSLSIEPVKSRKYKVPVLQINLKSRKIVKKFNSVKEASLSVGAKYPQYIGKAIKNEEPAFGYLWKYEKGGCYESSEK